MCAAHLNDFVEPGGYVEASIGLLMIFALGTIIGPLLASGLMRAQGSDGLFIFTGGVHLCLAGSALYRCSRRASPHEEDRSSFTETLLMSRVAAEIDPRSTPEDQLGKEAPEVSDGHDTIVPC
jgi:hypothetical protein